MNLYVKYEVLIKYFKVHDVLKKVQLDGKVDEADVDKWDDIKNEH